MIGLYIEQRALKGTTSLSQDLVGHILRQQRRGRVAIVTNKPITLLGAVRKQWSKTIHRVEREQVSTLGTLRKLQLADELSHLRRTTFTTELPINEPIADIAFATARDFLQAPPTCYTLYITCAIERHERYMLASWMPPHGLVVVYES